jgi:hypothetical protein
MVAKEGGKQEMWKAGKQEITGSPGVGPRARRRKRCSKRWRGAVSPHFLLSCFLHFLL